MTRHSWIMQSARAGAIVAALIIAPSNSRAETGAATPAAATAAPQRSSAQLEQLVAPIALYPDGLLSQILMASTYPLEVVAAARWSAENPGVTGNALEDAMAQQPWDPSVKALTSVPQALQMMNDRLDWMQELGDAFLAQQANLLSAVQRLRARADAAGNLKTTEQQTVTRAAAAPAQSSGGGVSSGGSATPVPIYMIEPTNPQQYSVPIYDPGVAYGAWPYSDYAPFYWTPPGYVGTGAYALGAGVLTGAAIWAGVNWRNNNVNINPNRYNSFNRTNIANGNWTHNAAHRGGVPYRDGNVAARFGDGGKAAARENFRGQADAGRRDFAKQGGAAKQGNVARQAKQGAGVGGAKGAKNAAGAKGSKATKAAANRASGAKSAGAKSAGAKSAKAGGARTKSASQGRHATGGGPHTSNRTSSAPRGGGQRSAALTPGGGARHARGPMGGGGGMRAASMRGGGMAGRGGGRGGGRRSDIRLKHDIVLLGRLDNGLGFYRFSYNGSDRAYVGVMAQEVQAVTPEAVTHGRDGLLRVRYEMLGLPFQTYKQWLASRTPSSAVGRAH